MREMERIEQLISAGGVVYRSDSGQAEIVVCGRGSPRIWGLPKGTPDPGETREQTALREVREETGLNVTIEGFIGSIEYWFVGASGTRYHKAVHFYLMSATGGDLSLHDHEFDVVEWLPAEKALASLSYENEARIVEKGLSLVAQ